MLFTTVIRLTPLPSSMMSLYQQKSNYNCNSNNSHTTYCDQTYNPAGQCKTLRLQGRWCSSIWLECTVGLVVIYNSRAEF